MSPRIDPVTACVRVVCCNAIGYVIACRQTAAQRVAIGLIGVLACLTLFGMLEGDRGVGRVHATGVSAGAESETLTNGTLTMRDGSQYALPAADAENTETDSADSWEQ
ncbi:hypothetical protein ACFQS6_14980 [Xanthomonas populi]|uniref:hypothetical protein n=1 Tax=Xanthomonas populi TaxID=53414 RepID=UPI002698B643